MGPPPFGDGNQATRREYQQTPVALQWGHRLSAMETSSPASLVGWSNALQWGHRLSAMETSRLEWVTWGRDEASMGPPPFGDGNIS